MDVYPTYRPSGTMGSAGSAPAAPAPAMAAPPPRRDRRWMRWLMTLILLAIVAGGVYYWQHQKVSNLNKQITDLKGQQIIANKQITDLNKQVAEAKKTADPYSSWKSYSKNGLELKYPSDWKLDEPGATAFINSPDLKKTGLQVQQVTQGAFIDITQGGAQKTITADNYTTSNTYDKKTMTGSTTTIGTYKVFQFDDKDTAFNLYSTTTVFFKSDGSMINVRINYPKDGKNQNLDTYNLILKSVKLT